MFQFLLVCLMACAIVLFIRLYYVYMSLGKGDEIKKGKIKVLAVAGSGGHTTELLRLLGSLNQQYSPRWYVVAETDHMSENKIKELEKANKYDKEYFIKQIPRSREVAQPWISSFFTSVIAVLHSFPLVWTAMPDLIICNGPGTCIPICMVALLYKVLGIKQIHIIFVESICRVNKLSLSGEILYHVADKVFVQWPQLKQKYPKSLYYGRIV